MNSKLFALSFISALAGTAAVRFGKKRFEEYYEAPDNKQRLWDLGDNAVQKLVGKLADGVSDKGIPFINRYEGAGFLEGSGYFLRSPAKGAHWSLGYAAESIVPSEDVGDLYIGGYLAFPPNKLSGIINEQMIRVAAIDDHSGRGIHVFAVIDCVGISGTDIRTIRRRLTDLIAEKNILSINISATHCHSGIDTVGLWGDLLKALKTNKKAVKSGKTDETVSGKNPKFMEYLITTAAETITRAVNGMKDGKLYYARLPIENFVHDKRPPYVTDQHITVMKFMPEDNGKPLTAVFMAAHPTCYGARQREAVCDFPRFMCDELEKNGTDAMFIQGAECAVAAERGPHIPEGMSHNEGIKAYGEAIARYVLSFDIGAYHEIEPMLNVMVDRLFLPADNKILEYAAKMRVVNNEIVRITLSDDKKVDAKDRELCFPTEVGFAEFGSALKLAMVPGELMPEIAFGGAYEPWESYNGKDWEFEPIEKILGGELAVVGLCNDFIGYIIPDNDFGSMFAPLHYEESVSAGGRTASNIVNAFKRMRERADQSVYIPAEEK